MLEYTPIAQFAIGTDHKVKVWNKACELLTGVSAEEIVGTDEQEGFLSKKTTHFGRSCGRAGL